jgi:hypothetical protein
MNDAVASALRDFPIKAGLLSKVAGCAVNPLRLSRGALLQYFLGQALSPEGIVTVGYPPDSLSDKEVADSTGCIARVAQHVLAGFSLDERTLDAIVWLVSNYAHTALGVSTLLDMRMHLLFAARGEPALYALKSYYRDHFFHALEVCFLGHFLLSIRLPTGSYWWELVADRLSLAADPKRKQRVLGAWYVAALFHDIGYWVDIQEALASRMAFFRSAPALGTLSSDLNAALDRVSATLGSERFQGYDVSDRPGRDHGVVGACHLSSLIERGRKPEPSIFGSEFDQAVRAIATHNSRAHTVSFADNPLGFLLILCDTVQEWNRMRFGSSTAPIEILDRLSGTHETFVRTVNLVRNVAVENLRAEGEDWVLPANEQLRIRIDYGPDVQMNWGVFNVWLDGTCNLQRLAFDGLDGVDVGVEYSTPLSPAKEYPHLYLLRDAARETHMSFLERWFPTETRDSGIGGGLTNGAIEHWLENPKIGRSDGRPFKLEHLRLNIRTLCSSIPKRIAADVGDFRKALVRWREYRNNIDHEGDYGAPDSPG